MEADEICSFQQKKKFIQDLFPLDAVVSVTDNEKFIAYHPGKKIDVKASVGSKIPSEDIIVQVIKTGKRAVAEEIRKLSTNSKDSTKAISDILLKINENLTSILSYIEKTEAISESQASAT